MSMQQTITTTNAQPVLLTVPSDIYFVPEAVQPQKIQLRALTALEEMYGFYGADLA